MQDSDSTKKIPTIDEVIELPIFYECQISPDGHRVAYTLSKPDWEQNEYLQQIWLVSVSENPQPQQFTFAKTSSHIPRWSPDGQWLAFLSRRDPDADQQIFRMAVSGGEAERITEIEGGVESFEWSPDSQKIAFTSKGKKSEAEEKRQDKYGDYHIEDKDYERSHLWVTNLEDRKVTSLTHLAEGHVTEFVWHPGGNHLAVTIWPSPDMKDLDRSRLAQVQVNTFGFTWLTEAGFYSPRWSPDGAELVFIKYGEPSFLANETIWAMPFGGGEPRQLVKDFDENPWLLNWTPEGIFFLALQRTEGHLFKADPKTGIWKQVTPAERPGWVSLEGSLSLAGKLAALGVSTAEQYKEVYVVDTETGAAQRLTNYTEKTKEWRLGKSEVIRWNSQDGAQIEGVLTKPEDFDPGRKYPLLVVIHGGPTWFSTPALLFGYERRVYPLHQWINKGALILQVNYRGSGGYGEAFRKLNFRNLGLGDYWDVISGVDFLIEKGWVDPQRVGAMGWSQGGYISAFITTYSDRFKAVSVGAGISNWMTYYVNTDIHPFTRQYLEATPWEDKEVYEKTSPMSYINNARTPTLIQHGEFDRRVPIPNAYELYQGLKDRGIEAKLVIYKGMPHGITKPRLNRQAMEENFNWFNRWLWDEMPQQISSTSCYITFCSAEKNKAEGELPALERYKSPRINDVHAWARRDQVDFRIFSGKFGLLAASDPIPWYDHTLTVDEIPVMANRVAEQLKAGGWEKLIVHMTDPKDDPTLMIYLGCLQIAAGLAGKITLTHQVSDEKTWKE
jgi:dipeptidyl aminopeptidase/acylaminoacyl peptidase